MKLNDFVTFQSEIFSTMDRPKSAPQMTRSRKPQFQIAYIDLILSLQVKGLNFIKYIYTTKRIG